MTEKDYPYEIAQSIAADTEKNMENNIGRLKILEQFDELPLEYRNRLLHMLSAFHRLSIARFYQMIEEEYGSEYHTETARGLKKLRMAGVEAEEPHWFEGTFYTAFCTPTRHMGALSVSIFWQTGDGTYTAECFLLNFGTEGVSNFVYVENISEEEMRREENMLGTLVRISLRDCQLLLTTACEANRKTLVRPSLGYYLYHRHLLPEGSFTADEVRANVRYLSGFLYGRRMINSLFLALKNRDMDYASSLFDWQKVSAKDVATLFTVLKEPGTLFLEGCADQEEKGEGKLLVEGHLLVYAKQQLLEYRCRFTTRFDLTEGYWLIEGVESQPPVERNYEASGNPLQKALYVRVYEITDMEALMSGLDTLEQVQKVGELPYGLHLRICTVDDSFFEQGVTLLSGVVADLVVNGEEFTVLADQETIPAEFDGKLAGSVEFKSVHKVSLSTAIQYYQGQYRCFEDVLELPEGALPQDPMQFITYCYIVNMPERFEAYLGGKNLSRFTLPDGRTLFYQFSAGGAANFEAEYIVDENYLAVSAFGEARLDAVRSGLEKTLRDCLSFEHTEVNPYGFFEILTAEVKAALPELEAVMKNIYLNQWLRSACPLLDGMTPEEANRTPEGKQLLWRLFQFMHTRPGWFSAGKYADIAIQEYLARLNPVGS